MIVNDPDYLQFKNKVTELDDEKMSSFTTHVISKKIPVTNTERN